MEPVQNKEYVEVGALWKDEKGVSGKLENGMRLYIMKNNYKEEGDNKPDLKIRMLKEDAEKLGVAKKEVKEYTDDTPF